MKYRTDFVTNSSSSSFAAAAVTTIAGIIASCNCTSIDPEKESDEDELRDDDTFLQKTMMPEGVAKLVAGGEPVFLYAQLCTMTEKGIQVLDEPTQTITYSVSTGGKYVQLGDVQIVGDFAAVDVYGVSAEDAGAPPETVKIKATCRYKKKRYTASFRLAFEAEAELVVKPAKLNFLSKTGESGECTVQIKNPGADPWALTLEPDHWAEGICTFNLEDISDKGDKAKLVVTEDDREETTGSKTDHYSKGKLIVNGSNGDKEISDYCEVYVWREGLFRMESNDEDRETGDILIKADKKEDGEMKDSIFDLRYMRWDANSKSLKCDTDIFASDEFWFGEVEPKDDGAEAILETANVSFTFDGPRPSNLPSGKFIAKIDKVIPGKRGERFRFDVTATVDNGLDYFDVKIPFAIVPAYLSEGSAEWQKEYDYCKKMINEFFPESRKAAKLAELEDCKHYMGAADLKQYRKDTWSVAYDIIMKQKQDYEDEAAWYDKALYITEWVQWLNDRAFSATASALLSPAGAIVAGQVKELLQDMIAKFVTVKATDTWMDIAMDLLYSRSVGLLGGSLDAKYFSNPEVSKKWIAMFWGYKFVFHWAFDYEGNERKGCIEAAKAACLDLGGVGMEEKMKPFFEGMASRGLTGSNMAVDEFVLKTAASMRRYLSMLYTDESGSAN
jgi:hypothetical protein